MALKKKLLMIMSAICLLTVMITMGVWAVKKTDFIVGGDIGFTTTGLSATISQGVISDASAWVNASDADIKMKPVELNTDKTLEEIEKQFSTWKNLNLVFNENGDDVSITFTITNTSKVATEYLKIDIDVSASLMKNATATVNENCALLDPNGGLQEFIITFSVIDKSANATLAGFAINFNMEYETPSAVNANGTSTDFNFTLNNDNTAVLTKSNSTTATELIVPGVITTPDGAIYKVTSMADGVSYDSGVFYATRSTLEKVSLPATMTNIGNYAFYNSGLGSIKIPSNVTNIGTYAFGLSGIASVEIPSSVKTIGDTAFRGTDLVSVDIPSSVENIGTSAFMACSKLKSVKIPSSVTRIGNYAFGSCRALEEVEIADGVQEIGNLAFSSCVKLASVKIPSSVTSIGYQAFAACIALEELELPSSVETIGDSAFNVCTSLTIFDLPSSLTSIADDLFNGCSNLLIVNIPESVKSIGTGAFLNCSSLLYLNISEGVESIGDWAFEGCSRLTEVTIPSTVSQIGERVFGGCDALEAIVVDGDNATYDSRDNCNAIIETSSDTLIAGCNNSQIPSTVKIIGASAFNGVNGINTIEIPFGVEKISFNAFYGCLGLTEINIPSSVTEVDVDVFFGCGALEKIVVDSQVIYSDENLSSVLTSGNMASLYIPQGHAVSTEISNFFDKVSSDKAGYDKYEKYYKVYSDGWGYDQVYRFNLDYENGTAEVFVGEEYMLPIPVASLNIPSKIKTDDGVNSFVVTSIGMNAFSYISYLIDIKIPSSVTTIGERAFADTGLTSITIPEGVTVISQYMLQNCANLETVQILGNVTEIGDGAFKYCASLKEFEIPSTVTTIGDYAFEGSGLISITIPEGGELVVEGFPFIGCENLETVIIDSETIARSRVVLSRLLLAGASYVKNVYIKQSESLQQWDIQIDTIRYQLDSNQDKDGYYKFVYVG